MDRATKLAFGAFYTDDDTAQLLANWALRTPLETTCDPSFGGGAFLRRCIERVSRLGGQPQKQVFGVEIDELAFRRAKDELGAIPLPVPSGLQRNNFFDVSPSALGPFDSIVGNPPYIRHHRFARAERDKALRVAQEGGVLLPQLANAWAPFLVHAVRFIKPGGRLAMVLPAEVLYATYSMPVLSFLQDRFGRIDIFAFKESQLFPDLAQGAVVLLADLRGSTRAKAYLHVLRAPTDLASAIQTVNAGRTGIEIDLSEIAARRIKVAEYLIDAQTRGLYYEISRASCARELSVLADIDIGYVTGAANFFHLTESAAQLAGIPKTWRMPVLRRGRHVKGLRFTLNDWSEMAASGETAYLLAPPQHFRGIPAAVRAYHNNNAGKVAKTTFKCSDRDPWWRVPISFVPEGFLIYGCGEGARIVINSAGLAASNAVHVVRRKRSDVPLAEIACSWLSAFSRLSVEIEGHRMGGGMLKLDPTDAERTRLVLGPSPAEARRLCSAIDRLLRRGRTLEARGLADAIFLKRTLGLSQTQVDQLAQAADLLARHPIGGGRKCPSESGPGAT